MQLRAQLLKTGEVQRQLMKLQNELAGEGNAEYDRTYYANNTIGSHVNRPAIAINLRVHQCESSMCAPTRTRPVKKVEENSYFV